MNQTETKYCVPCEHISIHILLIIQMRQELAPAQVSDVGKEEKCKTTTTESRLIMQERHVYCDGWPLVF